VEKETKGEVANPDSLGKMAIDDGGGDTVSLLVLGHNQFPDSFLTEAGFRLLGFMHSIC